MATPSRSPVAALVLETLYDNGIAAVVECWPHLTPTVLAQMQRLLTEHMATAGLLQAADEAQARLDAIEADVVAALNSSML